MVFHRFPDVVRGADQLRRVVVTDLADERGPHHTEVETCRLQEQGERIAWRARYSPTRSDTDVFGYRELRVRVQQELEGLPGRCAEFVLETRPA
ncbi:hypothetical protein [Streptomyces sp. NPDC055105]|uniref:hypothetical protein n=1 Tax=Streptomyces sp. NPDC055105 TaxID=3365719 RepID=UPI0037D8FB13